MKSIHGKARLETVAHFYVTDGEAQAVIKTKGPKASALTPKTKDKHMSQHYGKGQKDGSKNRYSPPHEGIFREAFGLHNKRELSQRKEYKDGYRNARKQRS
jgi:hypothetical protein